MVHGTIKKVAGPLVVAENMQNANMYDMVLVSDKKLIGEIIEIRGDLASIQVYEETGGVAPGEPVESLDIPMSVELGPGLISTIFDGIQRPLSGLYTKTGNRLDRGVRIPSLDREKKWEFTATAAVGDEVFAGDVIGTVQETPAVMQKIMIPPGVSGKIEAIQSGSFTVDETIATIKTANGAETAVSLMQKWPVRKGRPYQRKLNPDIPLVTGQRVIDTLFPLAEGGTASVPGPFGSGKTVVQHQLAKWANVDIVVYIGCGERGNEMTDVLHEFPRLIDPHTGRSLMERTVLIANTSDMPVAAREASIYTGITIAEFFRDMGYSVALMADSTSRWAEALREISGRLEEMPGEEGYPAYLGSRLAQFYERAGRVVSLGKDGREGALSVIGAVSPPGGDISEPVSQATLRIVKVFWNLDAQLAYARHFPAISWLNSYSLYSADMDAWFNREIASDWSRKREEVMILLDEESRLSEIVRLVGMDALSPEERLKMETARGIREDFLHQNSFDPVDTYASLQKQNYMLNFIVEFHRAALGVLKSGGGIADILDLQVREKISRFKYLPEDQCEAQSAVILDEIKSGMDAITPKGEAV